jgi:DNA repair exonuclease SbcCD ATPase subunit
VRAASAIDNLSRELRRCWARLDGRAATIRRLLERREEATRYKWMAVRMAMKAWRERDEARIERHKLRDAIQRAGFAVCETSGDWMIHDVSEHAKAEEEKVAAVINRNIDLELENERLRADLAFQALRADYHEHDADCCGGCTTCRRLWNEFQEANRERNKTRAP